MTSIASIRKDSPPEPGTRRRVRLLAALPILLALTVVVAAASLAIGANSLDLGVVIDGLTNPDPANPDHAIVQARIPRTAAALLVGAALGLAGAVLQGLTRNPLADPGILGLNGGAALAVVVGIATFGIGSINATLWWAFAGAGIAAVLVYFVASLGRGGASPLSLALAGAALNAAFLSVVQFLIIVSQSSLEAFRQWSVGSVALREWSSLTPAIPFLVAGLLVCLGCARWLNGLALGEDTARGLGQNVALTRIVGGIGVVLLGGAATAAVGPIAFLGLVVPHAVRALVGSDYRRVLPLSLLGGAVLLTTADVVGRVIAPPGEVQVAVMTAVIGIPVFLWLVRRRKAVEL